MNMPTVSSNDSKVKKKLFSLDSLLKLNQSKSTTNSYNKSSEKLNDHSKVDSATATATVAETTTQKPTASVIKSDKMFMDNLCLSRFNTINSRTIQSGHLRAKTSVYVIKKSNYFRLRQYGERLNVKILLECYKDDSLHKIRYIIDLDNVDQIDLKEHMNTIYLSRSNMEFCTLEAPDKTHTMLWLNAICRHCGFNEIKTYDTDQIPTEIKDSLNSESNKRAVERLSVKKKESIRKPKTKAKSIEPVLSSNKKVIAGIAATSVGSYDLCNDHLDKIFKKNSSELDQGKGQGSNILAALFNQNKSASKPDSYIPLQDCQSGKDQQPHRLNKSESSVRVGERTARLESSDGVSQSTSSLEKFNISTKAEYDEDYSIFDLDVESSKKNNSNFYLKNGETKAWSTAKNMNKSQLKEIPADTSRSYRFKIQEQLEERGNNYYNQDTFKNLKQARHDYYNYPLENMTSQKQSRNNDYINYTETFDKTYAEEEADQMEEYIGLGYVQLEIVESRNPNNKNETNKVLTRNNAPFSSSSRGEHRIYESSRMYTSCDVLRTQALKHTQEEFQRS